MINRLSSSSSVNPPRRLPRTTVFHGCRLIFASGRSENRHPRETAIIFLRKISLRTRPAGADRPKQKSQRNGTLSRDTFEESRSPSPINTVLLGAASFNADWQTENADFYLELRRGSLFFPGNGGWGRFGVQCLKIINSCASLVNIGINEAWPEGGVGSANGFRAHKN